MLVHKQEDLSKLNDQKLQAEQRVSKTVSFTLSGQCSHDLPQFMELQNALLSRQIAEVSFQGRRHSVTAGVAQDAIHSVIHENR